MKKLQPLTGPVSFWELLVIAYIVLYHTGYSSWPWWYPWAALLLPHILTMILDRVFADEEIDADDGANDKVK